MTQEMLIMAAILVAVILLTFIGILSRYRKCRVTKSSLYTVKQGEKRNQPSYITVGPLSYGRSFRATNSFL